MTLIIEMILPLLLTLIALGAILMYSKSRHVNYGSAVICLVWLIVLYTRIIGQTVIIESQSLDPIAVKGDYLYIVNTRFLPKIIVNSALKPDTVIATRGKKIYRIASSDYDTCVVYNQKVHNKVLKKERIKGIAYSNLTKLFSSTTSYRGELFENNQRIMARSMDENDLQAIETQLDAQGNGNSDSQDNQTSADSVVDNQSSN